jgi:hypothetical protein
MLIIIVTGIQQHINWLRIKEGKKEAWLKFMLIASSWQQYNDIYKILLMKYNPLYSMKTGFGLVSMYMI